MNEESQPVPTPPYQSFIVRIWREDAGIHPRFSIQSVTDSNRHGFTTLTELLAYISQLIEGQQSVSSEE